MPASVAVPIGPAQRMAVVAGPAYFEARPKPLRPQDLTQHNCINFRLPTRGGVYVWEFERDGRELKVRVEGQFVFNTIAPTLEASLAGVAIAYLPEDVVAPHLAAGRLVRVLEDWCAPFPGYHLYYPSRRQTSPAFALIAEALRHRE
jgi:DNA-binding transcriptional LysR family regulator